MPWIGKVSERFYYNPTTNRIPLSILENAQRYALAEAQTNFLSGIDDARYDDVATPWLTIETRKQSIPIVPTVEVTLSPESKGKIVRAIERRKAAERQQNEQSAAP